MKRPEWVKPREEALEDYMELQLYLDMVRGVSTHIWKPKGHFHKRSDSFRYGTPGYHADTFRAKVKKLRRKSREGSGISLREREEAKISKKIADQIKVYRQRTTVTVAVGEKVEVVKNTGDLKITVRYGWLRRVYNVFYAQNLRGMDRTYFILAAQEYRTTQKMTRLFETQCLHIKTGEISTRFVAMAELPDHKPILSWSISSSQALIMAKGNLVKAMSKKMTGEDE